MGTCTHRHLSLSERLMLARRRVGIRSSSVGYPGEPAGGMWPDDELFEHPETDPLPPSRPDDLLHVNVLQGDVVEIIDRGAFASDG